MTSKTVNKNCVVCKSELIELFKIIEDKKYWKCNFCQAKFLDEVHRLDLKEERNRYEQHNNKIHDEAYRSFLSKLAEPLKTKLSSGGSGLDFGCGPGPTLSIMLEEAGHTMELYDIYYHPDTSVLEKTYDFMTATEVIEHLYHPDKVWQQWLNLVKPKGWIGLMTKLVIDVDAFAGWHYKNDPTHVVFFSRHTFQFLAERDKLELEFFGNDVILLRKVQ